jgi:hypothetical protein
MTNSNQLENPSISKKELKMPLLCATAIVFCIAAVLALISLISLVSADGIKSFFIGIEESGVRDPEAMFTYYVVSVTTRLLYSAFCGVYAVGLVTVVIESARVKDVAENPRGVGLRIIAKVTHAVKYTWIGVCAILAVIFISRFVPYLISNIDNHTGLLVVVALVASEGACLAIFRGICYGLMHCWSELEDSADCARYMLSSGKICDIPHTAYSFCYVLVGISLLCAVISLGDVIATCAFTAAAVASLLLGVWYKKLKSQVEWIKYQDEKKRKQKI